MTHKIARLVAFCVVVGGAAGHAAEVPDEVAAAKCTGKRKAFGFIDDPTAPSRPHKFRMKSAFYYQVGSVAVSACKPLKGQSTCQEGMTLGFLLPSGFTGDLACGAGGGVLYVNYSRSTPDGSNAIYWEAQEDCVISIVKNDDVRGRIKGTVRATVTAITDEGTLTAPLVGCFSARRRDISLTR